MGPQSKTEDSPVLAAEDLPLSALLSQVLVAFIIEFDNEAEHQMPHRTSRHGAAGGAGPWLVSLAMWSNCMRFVDEQGIRLGDLQARARTMTNLDGMRRWGYVTIETRDQSSGKKLRRADWILRATPNGVMARHIWQPLARVIEQRWTARFANRGIDELRAALLTIAFELPARLPDCLPILGYGLRSQQLEDQAPQSRESAEDLAALALSSLLSRVLFAFALEFEAVAGLSIAIAANVLRPIGKSSLPVRELPRLSGVSKESASVAVGFLKKRGLLIEQARQNARGKEVFLTAAGRAARQVYFDLTRAMEAGWRDRYGSQAVRALRARLEDLVCESGSQSPLFEALKPYPSGWRATVRAPLTLPHYPMVLHRGGFPDGS